NGPAPGPFHQIMMPRPRRLLLLVNPFSGRGQAMQWCQTHILPMIREASISYNLIQTERQNHARELIREISLPEWDGIIIISGDGLLHEVINGLMERPDWEQAIKTPVGILPCGSGNALAGSINHYAGFDMCLREPLLLNCCFLLCRGGVMPMDMVSVTTSPSSPSPQNGRPAAPRRLYSFLSVAWGFVSDVDIESERYRGLGSARFTLGTLVRLASLRSYKGRLSYLPVWGGSFSPPRDDLLPPLDQPLPTRDWVTIEGDFVLVLAIYQSHLGADLLAAPQACFNDGLIHLTFVRAGISRATLLRLFLAMERGAHLSLSSPYVSHVTAKAFRLQPLSSKGTLTVDGELVPYGPLQAQVKVARSYLQSPPPTVSPFPYS
uniref:sphingosine kinase n=1 Tax=Denticeps clupeoides TaxID=299321 RepID=A0AAY4ALP1_9TELE